MSDCDLREVRTERDSFEFNIIKKYGIENNDYDQDKTSVSDMDPFQKQILKNQKMKSGKNSIIGATELEEETGKEFLDDSDMSLKDINRKYNLGLSRSRSVSKTRSNITRSASRTKYLKISSRKNSRQRLHPNNKDGNIEKVKTEKKASSPPRLLEALNFDSLEKNQGAKDSK